MAQKETDFVKLTADVMVRREGHCTPGRGFEVESDTSRGDITRNEARQLVGMSKAIWTPALDDTPAPAPADAPKPAK